MHHCIDMMIERTTWYCQTEQGALVILVWHWLTSAGSTTTSHTAATSTFATTFATLNRLLLDHVNDLVRYSQVFDGAAAHVALRHAPKLVAVLATGNKLIKAILSLKQRLFCSSAYLSKTSWCFKHTDFPDTFDIWFQFYSQIGRNLQTYTLYLNIEQRRHL